MSETVRVGAAGPDIKYGSTARRRVEERYQPLRQPGTRRGRWFSFSFRVKPCPVPTPPRGIVSRSGWEVGVWGLGRGPLELFVSRKLRVFVVVVAVVAVVAVAVVAVVDRAQDDRIMQMEQVCKVSAHGHRQPICTSTKLTQTARSERLGP